jgi:hypothetical protein
MLCYAMLCYAVLCYVMLCCVMLCYVMRGYVMLCMLCCAMLSCAMSCIVIRTCTRPLLHTLLHPPSHRKRHSHVLLHNFMLCYDTLRNVMLSLCYVMLSCVLLYVHALAHPSTHFSIHHRTGNITIRAEIAGVTRALCLRHPRVITIIVVSMCYHSVIIAS